MSTLTGFKEIVVALDVNGTLLKRFYKYDKLGRASLKRPDAHCAIISNHIVYYRPYLKELSSFLNTNNIKYVLWSTMRCHNVSLYAESLKSFGFSRLLGIYDESHCQPGKFRGKIAAERWLKDLRLLSDQFSVPLKNCVLVDDDVLKSVEGCNFIHIKEYDPNEPDDELLTLIAKLRRFLDAAV